MTSLPSLEEIGRMTPMMQQYFDLKRQCGDAILFFRMGDFYEIFDKDAEEMAPKLEIVLTARERGDKKKIPFCGVPHHSAKVYWLKLLKMGYKVAIADQVEDASEAKGIVKRAIVRTITPGCIEDLEGLDADRPNYLMAINENPESRKWACLVADISTGELRLGVCEDHMELREMLSLYQPKELLTRRFLQKRILEETSSLQDEVNFKVDALDESSLHDDKLAIKQVKKKFGSLKSNPCGPVPGGEVLVTAFLEHLSGLQASTDQFLKISPLREADSVALGEIVLRDLEIYESSRRRNKKSSLIASIDKTVTPMGSRLLRWSIARPLLKKDLIDMRLSLIDSLKDKGEEWLADFQRILKHTPDLSRLATRIISKKCTPLELFKTQQSLYSALEIKVHLEKHSKTPSILKPYLNALQKANAPFKLLQSALQENPGQLGKGNEVFKSGFDRDLDKLVELFTAGEQKIAAYQESLRQETQIPSLKIKAHKTFGLLIEVTKANLNKVPEDFIRKQTMVNCERFVTTDLKDLEATLLSAQDTAIEKELQIFEGFIEELTEFFDVMHTVSQKIAELDLTASYAYLATYENFSKPSFSEKGKAKKIQLKACRHPVVERNLGRENYVPNDILVNRKECQLLITGPNMAGKSTTMRQVAIASIIGQSGGFVPAQEAVLPIFDQFYTRVGASDDLAAGQSTFMVEMSEAAYILKQASKDSLVILDEVGRGTSTQDGFAIAKAILDYLSNKIGCWAFFATHYHELAPVAEALANVKNVQTEVTKDGSELIFTHRLIPGASGSSFGIEAARRAGVPSEVLSNASSVLRTLQQDEHLIIENKAVVNELSKPDESSSTEVSASINFNDQEILARIEAANLNRMNPIQALNFLFELQKLKAEEPVRQDQASLFSFHSDSDAMM